MSKNMTRILIETTIKNAIKQIKDDPERSIRNVVDMALNFTNGRFQKHLLTSAQTMLKNENSCYYKLIPDMVFNVDEKRIITFGMNIGYNSCTIGAKKIREIEAAEQYNIPWAISLDISGNKYITHTSAYHSLIEQGMHMGVYTWNIHSHGELHHILELAEIFPECAFPIFCSSEEISPAILDDVNDTNNVMFVIQYSEHLEPVCELLRSRKILFSVSFSEQDMSCNDIENILSDTENMHSAFTIFMGNTECPLERRSNFYQYIQQTRMEQKYRTIPFDMIQDNLFIDSIISDEACSIGFTQNGDCYSLNDHTVHKNYNFFDCKLSEILSAIAPKKNF